MKRRRKTTRPSSVRGLRIPAPRATVAGLFWVSCALATPLALALFAAELAWRLWSG